MEAWTRLPLARFVADRFNVQYEKYDDQMKQAIREVGVRNLMIEKRLQQLLHELNQRHVPVIVMKGCHLNQALYPFGIRAAEDIDIVVDRKYFKETEEVVKQLAYKSRTFAMDLWTHMEVSNKITYMDTRQTIIPIDVHFTLGPYPYLGRISFEDLYSASEIVESEKFTLRVLTPEMLLIHLCLHLFQHHQDHWQVSALDMSSWIGARKDQINWSLFVQYVSKYKLALPVKYSLERAAEIAPIEVPQSALTAVQSIVSDAREQRIFNACLQMVSGREKHIVQWWTLPSWNKKLKCLQKIMFPGRAYLRHYYKGNYLRYVSETFQTTYRALRRNFK